MEDNNVHLTIAPKWCTQFPQIHFSIQKQAQLKHFNAIAYCCMIGILQNILLDIVVHEKPLLK